MSLRRVVIPDLPLPLPGATPTGNLTLSQPFAHYLQRVLRLSVGQEIELCDGRNRQWRAAVVSSQPDLFEVSLLEALPPTAQSFPVYLAQALPKSDRFEQILQRCTELGVAGFYPFFSQRCVVRLDEKRATRRMERWRLIVQEACRQCQRTSLPFLEEPCSLPELFQQLPPDIPRVVCWEKALDAPLHDWIQQHPTIPGLIVCIGPEGGFGDDEVTSMIAEGIQPVGLGPLILRTETAGPAVSAILQYQYGALGHKG